MKILLLPIVIIFLPVIALWFLINYIKPKAGYSLPVKIILAILVIPVGFVAAYYAILLSIEGMTEKGITCMTGIAFFIPVSLFADLICIPYLLFFYKKHKLIKLKSPK